MLAEEIERPFQLVIQLRKNGRQKVSELPLDLIMLMQPTRLGCQGAVDQGLIHA